ncbi:hypothetical protein ASF96_14625 [Microbacterium sp. Leaf179]|nr:hypothetical protein ASF96_14625 [Microbacterium sp. Leaf179]
MDLSTADVRDMFISDSCAYQREGAEVGAEEQHLSELAFPVRQAGDVLPCNGLWIGHDVALS